MNEFSKHDRALMTTNCVDANLWMRTENCHDAIHQIISSSYKSSNCIFSGEKPKRDFYTIDINRKMNKFNEQDQMKQVLYDK